MPPALSGPAKNLSYLGRWDGNFPVPPFRLGHLGWPSPGHLMKVRCAVPPLRWDVLGQVGACESGGSGKRRLTRTRLARGRECPRKTGVL
jgi:hypothetical protein